MATQTAVTRVEGDEVESGSFQKFGGWCAILAGAMVFLYSVAFVVLARTTPAVATPLYSLFQLLGGLFTTGALVALYMRVRSVDMGFALWGLLLGLVSAVGSAIHGGYLLSNEVIPPSSDPLAAAGLPNAVDPRGLLTFGVASIAVFVLSWLMRRTGQFPTALAYLGYGLAILLLILYLGRLIVFRADNPLVYVPAFLTGFIANPAWYIWLGLVLMRGWAAERRWTAPAREPDKL